VPIRTVLLYYLQKTFIEALAPRYAKYECPKPKVKESGPPFWEEYLFNKHTHVVMHVWSLVWPSNASTIDLVRLVGTGSRVLCLVE